VICVAQEFDAGAALVLKVHGVGDRH